MTYEERQKARHVLGKRLMTLGVLIMIAGHCLGGYFSQLPTDEVDWFKVFFTHHGRQQPLGMLGIIVGASTFTVGKMYRIDMS